MLAWQFAQGGSPAAAIEYRRRTGDIAMRRGAYAEAISQYQGAHDLVPKVTDEARRSFLELGVTESLGTALRQGITREERTQLVSILQRLRANLSRMEKGEAS